MDLSRKATEPKEVEDTTRFNMEHWYIGISWYKPDAIINGY